MLQLGHALNRTRHRGMGGNAMIRRSKIGLILLRDLHMLLLDRSGRKVRLLRDGQLLRRWPGGNSVGPTVEAGVGVVDDGRVVNDGCIHIGGPDHGRVHVDGRGVVSELASSPLAAGKAATTITKPVVYAAIEANLSSPITFMEDENIPIGPAPITRSPEIPNLRSEDPGTGDPIVVTFSVPGPITRGPHIVGFRTGGLHVNRNRGRSEIDADPD